MALGTRLIAHEIITTHFMKRKAPTTSSAADDPRRFQWHIFRRDEFVGLHERVWHKAKEEHGTVLPMMMPNDEEEGHDEQSLQDSDNKREVILSQPSISKTTSLRIVKFPDGSTASYDRPYDAIRMYKNPAIIIAYSTEDFRLLAETQDLGASVLEIGCSTGQSSRILWQRCKDWLGWDVGKAMVDRLQNEINTAAVREKNFRCAKMDPMVDPENAWKMVRAHFSSRHHPLSILMDIGGNRDAKAIAKVLKWAIGISSWKEILMIVIKSEEMHSFTDPLTWFLSLEDCQVKAFPNHPLKAPKRCCPGNPMLPICRYFNYHPQGCKKGSDCEFDHSHCHWCLQEGHKALFCTETSKK